MHRDISEIPVVILAGGKGTRISEESLYRPKPMVEIAGMPILWHVMKIYSAYGCREFIILGGYMLGHIKSFFVNFVWQGVDIRVNTKSRQVDLLQTHPEDWAVTIVDTGQDTMTGGRLKRVHDLLPDDRPFFFTYGDGVSDIDIRALYAQHLASGVIATVSAVIPPGRFGSLGTDGTKVTEFREKPRGDGAKINGGFFVLEKAALEYIEDDATSWERQPMEKLANDRQLDAFHHEGFWQPMDTLRDKQYLEQLWENGEAPWKRW